MKKVMILSVFVMLTMSLSAQNFKLDGKYSLNNSSNIDYLTIYGDKISYKLWNKKDELTAKYKIVHDEGLTFIKMSEKFPEEFTDEYDSGKKITTSDKILILAGKKIDSDSVILFGTTSGFYNYKTLIEPRHFEVVTQSKDCTSFLTEKNKKYPITNLADYNVDTPWVEGVSGYGIGESFTIENSWGTPRHYLLIMNGYISYEKPYLYKQNGRVKKIKVKGVKSGKEKILEVLDTPHPQTVDISFITELEDIRITIEDVYPGTKYEDTCINYMIGYLEKVIPYEDSIK